MLEFAKEIPVTFGPHWADEWMVYLTGLAVFASTAVAVVAARTAKDAKELARVARDEQQRLHQEQLTAAYNARVDAALVNVISEISEYLRTLRDFLEEADEVEIHHRVDRSGYLDYPSDPAFDGVRAAFSSLVLVSREGDVEVARAAQKAAAVSESLNLPHVRYSFKEIATVIEEWRSSQVSREATLERLARIETRGNDYPLPKRKVT